MARKRKSQQPVVLSDHDKVKIGWKYSNKCLCCNAMDQKGKPLREAIDAKAAIGWSLTVITSWLLKTHKVKISYGTVGRHLRLHSPHVDASPLSLSLLQKNKQLLRKIQKEFADSNDALQRIINIGDYMIRTGTLPVTEKLYIDAIREQGKRRVEEKLDKIMQDMEKDWIRNLKKQAQKGEIEEGEIVDDKKPSGPRDAGPVQRKLGKRLPQPGTVRDFVHV